MKLRSVSHLIIAVCLASFLAACGTTPNRAPVVEKSGEVPAEPVRVVSESAVAKPSGEARPSYTVKKGDSLSRIAQEFGQSVNDLVLWNNLKNPNDIKVDQVIWIGAPDATGVKVMPVNNNANVETRNLNPINPATNKTAPRGDKRPYSETNFAELQKAEGIQSPVVKTDVVPTKSTDKPVAATVAPAAANPSSDSPDWIWPTDGKVISQFDDKRNKGLDVSGKLGQDVVAMAAGKVIYLGVVRGYGNMLVVKHANDFLSAYAHNKTILVKMGQIVTKGQKIAEMGNTDSDIIKLHFEIRQGGKPIDPMKLLPLR